MNHDEKLWQAQERARELARYGNTRGQCDAASHADRLVAHALRTAPLEPLPSQFASELARQVSAFRAEDMRLERHLTTVLGLVLGIMGVATTAYYGGDWWQTGREALPLSTSAFGWMTVLAGCVGLSWLTGLLKPQ